MDRLRLESARLKYAVLSVSEAFAELDCSPIFESLMSVSEILKSFTPNFYDAFCCKYRGMGKLMSICVAVPY